MMATIRPTATPAATRPITFFQALLTSASGLARTTAPMGWSPLKIGRADADVRRAAPSGVNWYTGREFGL